MNTDKANNVIPICGRGYWRWRKTYLWERVLEMEEDIFVGEAIGDGGRRICGRGY